MTTLENGLNRTPEQMSDDYATYRGRCKELADAAAKDDPMLTVVRGHYYCPIWNVEEAHWWCQKPDGTIVDPSRLQFPSAGTGIYEPFDGTVECAQCKKRIKLEDADIEGRYAFCSHLCHGMFVGVF